MAHGPVGRLLGDHLGEIVIPLRHQLPVGLEMELDAVDRAADAERLVCGHGAGGEVDRAGRQGEGVEVPVEERRAFAERGEHRIAAPGGGRSHPAPAELDRAAENVLRPMAAGDELGTEADAEHRLVGLAEGARQRRDPRQIGMLVVVEGALLTAEHDEPVKAVGRARQPGAVPDAADLGGDARLGKGGTDLAKGRAEIILDDQDTHFVAIHSPDLVAWPARPHERRRDNSMRLGESRPPEGTRLYAIGDVHGCDAMLAEMHGRIAADLAGRPVADHRIVHIGDYVDRGPDCAGVIERLAGMMAADRRVICLKGNHDAMFADFLDDPVGAGPIWLGNGGEATLESYHVTPGHRLFGGVDYRDTARRLADALPLAHRRFIGELPLTARFGDYLFVHAGIRPGVPLEDQDPQDLIWIREDFLWDGSDHGFVVIHGHTPANPPEVMPNRINVDTGAVYGGPLTCVALEGTDYRFL